MLVPPPKSQLCPLPQICSPEVEGLSGSGAGCKTLMVLLLQHHFEEQLNSSDDGENDGPRWVQPHCGLEKPPPGRSRGILGLDGATADRTATLPGPQSLLNPLDPAQPRVFMAAFRRHSHLPPACFLVTDSPSATLQKG